MKKKVIFVISFILGIAFTIGKKHYFEKELSQNLRPEVNKACHNDQQCLRSIDLHFETCFKKNFIHGRRKATRVDEAGLYSCLNKAAGKQFFK